MLWKLALVWLPLQPLCQSWDDAVVDDLVPAVCAISQFLTISNHVDRVYGVVCGCMQGGGSLKAAVAAQAPRGQVSPRPASVPWCGVDASPMLEGSLCGWVAGSMGRWWSLVGVRWLDVGVLG